MSCFGKTVPKYGRKTIIQAFVIVKSYDTTTAVLLTLAAARDLSYKNKLGCSIMSSILFAGTVTVICKRLIASTYKFTDTEAKVIALLYFGFTKSEIAESMFRSKKTIQRHIDKCRSKTNTKTLFSLALVINNVIQG